MKGKIILGCLIVLFLALAVPSVSAAYDVCTGCHPSYVDAIRESGHANSDYCINCHKGSYDTSDHQDSTPYIGYNVTEATCNTSFCHSSTSGSGQRPVNESHGNKYYGPNKADCTQCHFANTTRTFIGYNTSLYIHNHNLTVEYNFYNYNLSGMPLSTNGGVGKGMFPYYTCTLTCHNTYKIEDEVIGWNQSKHAQSYEGQDDNNAYCAKCKSPTQYKTSADTTYNASANRSDFPIAESNWQGIQCRICHNIHNDTYSGTSEPAFPLAYYNPVLSYNASRPVYDQVSNATVLCQKCHSNRNFAGVHKDTVGFDCADCHANSTFSNTNHTFEVKNTTSGVEGCEVCHDSADHTWEQTSKHTDVDCWACHDQTVSRNTSGYAVGGTISYGNNSYGIYKDPVTSNWTTYKLSHNLSATWVLHNVSKSVDCDKCHNATSPWNGLIRQDTPIGPALACTDCHSLYASVVNASKHNQTLYSGAPANCTICHSGYQPSYGHTIGTKGYIVNESNTCIQAACHALSGSAPVNESHGNHNYGQNYAGCTQCHFANTTQSFSLNASLYTHDHNLTVEYNYYNYSLYGFPTESDHGTSKKGMFPYYTCTLTCHNGTGAGQPKIEDEFIAWSQSGHAQLSGSASYNWTNRTINRTDLTTRGCITCKSPTQFNTSIQIKVAIADWQGIQCRICHNLHNDTYSDNDTTPISIAFYNGTLRNLTGNVTYDTVPNATVLCEKCHTGYHNPINYSGSHKTDLNFTCASCHMNSTINNGLTHTFEVSNAATGDTGCEACHQAEDHTFQFTSNHTGKATCEACHDKTVARNASGYAMSYDLVYGLYNDTTTGLISTFKYSSARVPSTKLLNHNTSKDVSCNKCHGTLSNVTATGLLAPTFGTIGCVKCHPSYASAVNNSMHNKTNNTAAPGCTDCHTGYDTQHTGYTGYIVNESNTCRNCHVQNINLSESHGNHNYGQNYTDCTQCHFANTAKTFTGFNSSLYTHDHNLTVEYNFYNYNLYGMPLESDHSDSKKGMFPYYTCTLTCHNGTGSGQPKIEDEVIAWNLSKHARSYEGQGDNNAYCAKCKSPTQYSNSSNNRNMTIDPSNWQGIQCRICHNLHNDTYSGNGTPPINISFYNTAATLSAGSVVYDNISNSTVLCQKCHSNRDFAGVHKDTVGFECTDCHANSTFNDETHLFEVKNTTSGATGCEVCHDATSAHSNFVEYSIHGIVTCEACHVKTVAKNSSDFVVSVISGLDAGLYKESSTNKWITYKTSHGAPATWNLHNISRSIDCYECHGARSVYNGSIAPNLTSGGTTYYTTDTLVTGYNLILLLLNPNPPLYAGNLLYTSPIGIPGVTKLLKWDSTNQTWVSYQYIVPSSGVGFYYGTNSTMDGYKAYFIKGNATTAGKTYTFVGTK